MNRGKLFGQGSQLDVLEKALDLKEETPVFRPLVQQEEAGRSYRHL